MHLLEPVGDLLERFAQPRFECGLQLFVDGGAHFVELLRVLVAQAVQLALDRLRQLAEALAELAQLLALRGVRVGERALRAVLELREALADFAPQRTRRIALLLARGREIGAHVALVLRGGLRVGVDARAQFGGFAPRELALPRKRGQSQQRDDRDNERGDECERPEREPRLIDHATSLAGAKRQARSAPASRRSRANARRRSARVPRPLMPAARCVAAAADAMSRRGSATGSEAAMPRQCHARDRLRPSRWTICGSLRSLTATGANSASGSPRASARKEAAEPCREVVGVQNAAHQVRFSECGRQEIGARRFPCCGRVAIIEEPSARAIAARVGDRARADGDGVVEREREAERAVRMHAVAQRIVGAREVVEPARDEGVGERRHRDAPAARRRIVRRAKLARELEQPRPSVRALERLRFGPLQVGTLAQQRRDVEMPVEDRVDRVALR